MKLYRTTAGVWGHNANDIVIAQRTAFFYRGSVPKLFIWILFSEKGYEEIYVYDHDMVELT